jgi:hypothetical protein
LTAPAPEPVLADALRVILPSEERTDLLRACLLSGEAGRRAWNAWRERTGDAKKTFEDDDTGLKGLLPLVQAALERNEVTDDKALLTYARAARLREELRSKVYREICGRVLTALTAAEVPVIALKACVVAETAYETPVVRHCHAVDLLVRDEDMARIAGILAAQEFTRAKVQLVSDPHHLSYQHSSGLPLELHTRLFHLPCYAPSIDGMWARSRPHTIAGAATRILSPADNVLHVCGHAAGALERVNLRWASDAWHIIDRHRDLDWQGFLDCAESSGIALPLYVMVRYLVEDLEAPVPPHVLSALAETAGRVGGREREAALLGALTGLTATVRALFHEAGSWRTRAQLIRFLLLPSPACMGWSYRIPHWVLLPYFYLYRPVRYVGTRVYRLIIAPPAAVARD